APLVVASAVLHTLRDVLPEDAAGDLAIKWPNDILLQQRKVCGILCESTLGQSDQATTLILGVGINANVDCSQFEAQTRYPPTSLQTYLGHPVDVRKLVEACGQQIEQGMTQ